MCNLSEMCRNNLGEYSKYQIKIYKSGILAGSITLKRNSVYAKSLEV